MYKVDTAQDLKMRLADVKKKNDAIDNELKLLKGSTISLSEPIVVLGETPVIYPNTITVIQGKTGSHKSRVAQNMISAVIAKDSSDGSKTMGFRCMAKSDIVVLYVDTERSYRDQLPLALQSIVTNAGYSREEDPENFAYTSFVLTPRDIRHKVLEDKLHELRELHGDKHILVVLDVITDLVDDFNEVKESMQFLDFLNEMCNTHKATVVGIIHENPFSDKARGHVGTELGNKATTALQTKHSRTLGDGTEVFTLTTTKFRNGKKPKPVYMQYDEALQNLVVSDSYQPEAEKSNAVSKVQDALPLLLTQEKSRPVLIDKLRDETGLGKDAVIKALGEIQKQKLPVADFVTGEQCILRVRNNCRPAMYFIEAEETDTVIEEEADVLS